MPASDSRDDLQADPTAGSADRRAPISIDVVSDVVCPWCYIGKRRLEAAMELVADEAVVSVRWRPFQLDPTIPTEGKDRRVYLAEKFGAPERIAKMHDRLTAAGAEDGIPFAFDRIERTPNTRAAHGLVAVAATQGRQDAVVETFFRGYFTEGADLSDRDTLVRLAESAGLDPRLAGDAIDEPRVLDGVTHEVEAAQRLGVDGVPFFILDGRWALVGAQPAAAIAEALRRIAAAKRGEIIEDRAAE